eukprot:RCo019606
MASAPLRRLLTQHQETYFAEIPVAAVEEVTEVLVAEVEKIRTVLPALPPEQLDVLMRFIYRGLESGKASSALLKWHAAVAADTAGGLGSIVRVLTHKRPLTDVSASTTAASLGASVTAASSVTSAANSSSGSSSSSSSRTASFVRSFSSSEG